MRLLLYTTLHKRKQVIIKNKNNNNEIPNSNPVVRQDWPELSMLGWQSIWPAYFGCRVILRLSCDRTRVIMKIYRLNTGYGNVRYLLIKNEWENTFFFITFSAFFVSLFITYRLITLRLIFDFGSNFYKGMPFLLQPLMIVKNQKILQG